MPVVVTGADGSLGAAVVDALLALGVPEIRATVEDRSLVLPLVARGVRTAVSDLVDPLRLGAVLVDAHTVLHLRGDEPLDTWSLLAEAAEGTALRRVVTVAGPGYRLPDLGGYDVVVVTTPVRAPEPGLVRTLVAADQRREVRGLEVVTGPHGGGPAVARGPGR